MSTPNVDVNDDEEIQRISIEIDRLNDELNKKKELLRSKQVMIPLKSRC